MDLDIACYQGGFGSGKTFVAALLGLMLCARYPGIRGLVAGKTWPLLRDTTLEAYFMHLEQFGLRPGQDYIWIATEMRLVFPCWGNSDVRFRGMDTPERVKSLNVGWIHAEEMSQLSENDFLMLLARLRQPDLERLRFFGTTNPEAGRGWIYRYFVEKAGKRAVTGPGGKNVTVNYRRIVASSRENKALPPGYVENLLDRMDADTASRYIDGLDGGEPAGLVCKSWSAQNRAAVTYRPDLPIYLSCDFNVDPMCWVLAHRVAQTYHFFDELCIEDTNTFQAAGELVRRYGEHRAGVVITGDASGNHRSTKGYHANETDYVIIRNVLLQHGLPQVRLDVPLQNPPVLSRVAAWNACAHSADNQVRILVNPDTCPYLVWNCETLRFIPGTSIIREPTRRQIEQDTTRTLKYTKHPFDAASYLVARYQPIRPEGALSVRQQLQVRSNPFRGLFFR